MIEKGKMIGIILKIGKIEEKEGIKKEMWNFIF